MKLSFIINQARLGELSALSKKDVTDEKIVSYLNTALIALYSRFVLEVDEALVHLRYDIAKTEYALDGTDGDVTVAGVPLVEDEFMSIISAYDEDGSAISLNDDDDVYSIFTTTYNKIQVPTLGTGNSSYISVIYRKNPTMVTFVDSGEGVAVDNTVNLPIQLLDAALNYIAYRAHSAVTSDIKETNNTHFMRYEAACDKVESLGLLTAGSVHRSDIRVKGFM